MRSVKLFSVLVIVAFLGALPAVAAAHPLQTNLFGLDGLFFATGGKTVKAGTLALGGSALIISDDAADLTSMPFTVTYGATQDIELALAYEIYRSLETTTIDESGGGDLFLSAKFAVQEEDGTYPATALGLRLKVPMADAPLGSEETDVELFAAMEMDMKGVATYLNIGYLLAGGDGDDEVNYAVGLAIPYSDTTQFTVELLDQSLVGDILAGGATFDVGEHLNFGAALGVGLTDAAADFAAQGKLTFTF